MCECACVFLLLLLFLENMCWFFFECIFFLLNVIFVFILFLMIAVANLKLMLLIATADFVIRLRGACVVANCLEAFSVHN